MSDHQRIRRPEPGRTGPIRGGSFDLFGAPGADAEPPRDPLARAVDLGYRVVDDYMRQGRQAARLLGKRAYTPEAFANDVQEMTAGLLQYGAELTDLWVGMFNQAAAAPATGPDKPASTAAFRPTAAQARRNVAPSAAPSPPSPANVTVSIRSPYRTEVTVSLDAPPAASLSVQPLQNAAGDARLEGATLHDGDPPRLELDVTAEAGPGRYYGLVLDDTSHLPVGTVVVEIHADDPPA
jgi:hypothetical protein